MPVLHSSKLTTGLQELTDPTNLDREARREGSSNVAGEPPYQVGIGETSTRETVERSGKRIEEDGEGQNTGKGKGRAKAETQKTGILQRVAQWSATAPLIGNTNDVS
jgi:hypothetical protein